jgi:multisubunit Na+/H+ antiporter MnhC subunit
MGTISMRLSNYFRFREPLADPLNSGAPVIFILTKIVVEGSFISFLFGRAAEVDRCLEAVDINP